MIVICDGLNKRFTSLCAKKLRLMMMMKKWRDIWIGTYSTRPLRNYGRTNENNRKNLSTSIQTQQEQKIIISHLS